MRKQQLARGDACPSVDGPRIVVAGVAHGGDPQGQFLGPGVVVPDMEVAVPQAGKQRLALAVDALCTRGHPDLRSRSDRLDQALVDDHGLAGQEASLVRIEHPHIDERDGPGRNLLQYD